MWGTQGWNQWALQPAMFNDVPHEQIDWAALAKQWIQMQHSPTDGPSSAPPPVTMNAPIPASAPILPPGHSLMVPPEENNIPLLKTPAPSGGLQEPFPPERHFEGGPGQFLPKTVDNSFWNKPQWQPSAAGDVDDRAWPAPVVEPNAPLLPGKETFDYGHMHDNPPLAMQSIDYNHMSDFPPYNQCLIDFRYPKKERKKEKILNVKKMKPIQVPSYPPENQYDQYWSQVNAAPTISPMFLKKERTNANLPVEEDTSQIDAAKRKQLPAWIRDGLEKMEQERLKRLEKERAAKEKAENLAKKESLKKELNLDDSSMLLPSKSKFESDSEAEGDEENATYADVKPLPVQKRAPSPVEDTRTEEEKKQDMMLKVRRMLTEILLSVTNAEIRAIAQDVYRKAVSKAPARQLASTASLTSVATGLYGLASYGTESEASEEEEEEENEASDSDGELYRKMKEKKKLFALKEKKIIAELERQELDERAEQAKIKNEKHEPNSADIEKNAKPIPDPEVLPEIEFAAKNDVIPFLETSAELGKDEIPFIKDDSSEVKNDAKNSKEADGRASTKSKQSEAASSHTSDSSSSSSETGTGSDESGKKKQRRSHESRSRKSKKESKSPSKQSSRHRRGRSKESDSPDGSKKSGRDEKSRSSSKKKKKYKRSDSSSSSSSTTKKHKHRSKYESNHSHRDRRSRSYDDRDRKSKRSRSSSRTHRKSDSYSSKSSKYGDGDKYDRRHKDEKKYKERRRTPSPHHRSSKLPKKYRSSRSPSSESEYYSKKSKKSRNH